MKEMRDGCNSCGGPYPSSKCDDKPMGGPKDEEANYAYGGYRGGGYRGNYYSRSLGNWCDRQPRDKNQNSHPREDNPSIPPTPEKKFDESDFEKTMREFMDAQKSSNDFSDKTYDPPVNPNAKTTVIYDDSKDEADEAKKEFIDLIKEVRINVPLVDVLAGMPNYEKFLKDPVSNKSKMEQIFIAFLSKECSVIVQNKLPPKLSDLISFLISCTLTCSIEYLALANLRASINLMSYSLYASLSENSLKPTRMSIRLANHTYQYPMGVAKNMLVQVRKFVFPVDFVILQKEEDDKVPLILGRPFLHTVDALIRVKNKELNLGVRDDSITFVIDKAIQHSHSNDDTCFRMDVIDELTKEELDALLDDSEAFSNTSEKINESSLDKEFKEFMAVDVEEILEQEEKVEDNFEELPIEKNLRIKTSIQDPSTDLEMKPLPKHLEYAFLEKYSLLPAVISSLLKDDEKKRLVSILKKHKEAFA
uniref:Reverse transcriptase domain-containing protein n=1 Tax=Tanacetum cinerariifolium TaxID=118510 RepID=A0A6L2JL14_TANCI|nr:reverse transcriptase domain-containing protein [Tanacetum cinerariifolium]